MVYWERQGQDCLCAVHCLNALLQGPRFTPVSLAEIAQELDSEEERILRDCASPSRGNVDPAGNFSSQVLFRALQRSGFSVVDSRHEEVRSEVSRRPERETGYICNLSRHWVALRKLPWRGGREAWFNLNSKCEGPMEVSVEWLAAFLSSAARRDTIFVVRGGYELPRQRAPLEQHQMLLGVEALGLLHGRASEALGPVGLPGEVPEPWRVVWAEAEAAYYFWNTSTGVTQWEHPTAPDPDAARVLDLARAGAWGKALGELAAREVESRSRGAVSRSATYVDHLGPSGRGLIHYAAAQGDAWATPASSGGLRRLAEPQDNRGSHRR